ncbi:nuclear receptor-binding factor 2b [Brienomyrus brachyistius]|uniref:nuclear receptor-binding factor 2b n=1 Tax=Brienomyrus brachyistius TaxID=42636 RepID=UPI0020B1EFF6|nr:nuclear receptor-binding factor 2b [Brienomyrus brachyistius]XP_048844080.1 nuclear receptor-binding factor 2b [Brienomyrus brachyistius]
MEVLESPLNLAHQQSRRADRLLVAGKYEEAISCHRKAADLLEEAMKLTKCEQAQLSLELQRESHLKQQRLIEEKWKRARREWKPRVLLSGEQVPSGQLQPPPGTGGLDREYDTWLYLLKNKGPPQEPCAGSKALKDDKTRLEEQETAIAELRRLVDDLLAKNERLSHEKQRLTNENQRLQAENARLRSAPYAEAHLVEGSDVWILPQAGQERKSKDIPIPHLPPLEMPTPVMELPEDIQHELEELLDREKL